MASTNASSRGARLERVFEWPLVVAALLVLPVLIIQEGDVGDPLDTIAGIANWAIWLTFAGYVVVMLAITPKRWAWIREHQVDIAIVLLTPPVFPAFLQSLRFLRLLRVIRLLGTARYSRRVFSLEGLSWVVVIGILALIGAGAALDALEPDPSISLWDGIWWAIGSFTTLGTEIRVTDTPARIISIVLVFSGFLFVALLAGAASERFLHSRTDAGTDEEGDDVREDLEPILKELRAVSRRIERIEKKISASSN